MLQPNLNLPGRVVRGLAGLGFAIACAFTAPHSPIAAAILGVTAAFMFFEAARGWCAARACGIKTPF